MLKVSAPVAQHVMDQNCEHHWCWQHAALFAGETKQAAKSAVPKLLQGLSLTSLPSHPDAEWHHYKMRGIPNCTRLFV